MASSIISPALGRSLGTTDPNNQNVSQQLSSAIKALMTDQVRGDVEREKIYQYSLARKHELYWRGDQFLVPTVSEGGMVVDWSPISGNVSYNNSDSQSSIFDYYQNDTRGYGRKFVAVLQHPPNCKSQPNRKGNSDHERRSRKADELSDQIAAMWEMGRLNRDLALSLFKNGTTFLYTPFVANPDRWGYSYEPVMEMRDVEIAPATLNCPQCGNTMTFNDNEMPPAACDRCGRPFGPADIREAQHVQLPEIVGRQRYANGAVECHVCNIFTVTAPFYSKGLKDMPFLYYEYEEHKGALLAAYPQLRKVENMRNDTGYNSLSAAGAYGRLARDTASSMSGAFIAPRKNRWLFTRLWLRPAMYELISDDQTISQGESAVPVREVLNELYPEGCRVTMVGDQVVSIKPERLERVWSFAKSDLSEYIFSDPYCKDFIPVQDLINDMHNIAAQTFERAVPQMGVIASRIDLAAWARMRPIAAELIPFTDGTDLNTVMHQLPMAKPDPAMGQWIDGLREHSAEIIGVTRPIFGGSLPTETAHQAELNKQASQMQLNLVWNEMRECHARARQNAILQLSEHSGGRVPDPYSIGGSITEVEDIEELQEGGWHIEAAEDFPMTWGERRAWLMQILGQSSPQVLAMMGFDQPENIEFMQEVMALTGWKAPNIDNAAKIMESIQELLQGAPVQQPQPDGTMLPMPSVPVDMYEDDHEFSAKLVKAWSQTEDGRTNKKNNPDGYQNVIAWMRGHLRLMTPAVAPAPGGGGGSAPRPAQAGGPPAPGGGVPSGAQPLPPAGTSAAPPSPAPAR